MSDALLTEISKKLSDIHAALKGGAAPAAASKPAAGTAAPAPDAAAKKAAAEKAAKEKAAKAAEAAKTTAAPGPKPGTKAPGGKRTIEQVREMIRKVAADVDKQSAKDILMDDGGGVEKVLDLKPENYDKVYEACQVLLSGEGSPSSAPAAEEDDLM